MKVRVSIGLSEELLKAVDRYAEQQGSTRSDFIEAALRAFLAETEDEQETLHQDRV
jgi:metal-responsive CopG/Arc/MetJ family transcriptional regulator